MISIHEAHESESSPPRGTDHVALLGMALALVATSLAAALPQPASPITELTVRIENSLTKVFADEPFTGQLADTLELSSARNEYEAGQVVLVVRDEGLEFWWVTWLWGKDFVDADLKTRRTERRRP